MRFPGAIRDPIHGYIRLTADELRGIDTPEVQRLRGITQLGLTERVYPGARHSRFEHALGTLEVATRIFEELRGRLGREGLLGSLGAGARGADYEHLLRVARWAALVHDLGHAPFSHVTEDLLAGGVCHESLSVDLLLAGALGDIVRSRSRELLDDVIAVLRPGRLALPSALGFVRELIAGSIGADRMDYLLRDSAATGVSYGVFDLGRVLHTIVPVAGPQVAAVPTTVGLGVERGGVLAVEGLLWSRVSMFQQVYYHRTRRILDRHLRDFLRSALSGGTYPADLGEYLEWTDARVLELLRLARKDPGRPGHLDAVRILERRHHRVLPQELVSDDVARLESWLHEWAEAVRLAAPRAEPIADILLPPPDATGRVDLRVVTEQGSSEPLDHHSALVGRLRLRPAGRLYVTPDCGTVPSFPST